MVTDRDREILLALDRYYVLDRKQIQSLVFPTDADGRITRRRLESLHASKLINRMNVQSFRVGEQTPPIAYHPSKAGGEFLAEFFKDDRYLLTPYRSPASHHGYHCVAVTHTHIMLDRAIALRNDLAIDRWINEWDVVNQDESDPEKHFQLYTLLRDKPRLVCIPDAAFLLSTQGFKKIYYLEQDRATSGAREVAAQKSQGYAALAEGNLQLKHFSEANVPRFTVLMVTTNANRRDSLKKAFNEKPGAELWRFVSAEDLDPKTLFTAEILHRCTGSPHSLLRKKED